MKKILILVGLVFQVVITQAQYCTVSSPNNHWDHQIQYFQFDSLMNVTFNVNPQPYHDYSATHIIRTKLGGKHFVKLSKGQPPFYPMAGNTIGFTIWVDFNNDYNFDQNEIVYTKYNPSGPNIYVYQDTIFFPATATTGVHRLRVRSGWGEAPKTPCGYIWDGEAEDYTINIASGLSSLGVADGFAEPTLAIYPNPSSENFTLDLKNNFSNVEVKITDLTGKIIKVHIFRESNLVNFKITEAPGIYLATVRWGNKTETFKLVKQ